MSTINTKILAEARLQTPSQSLQHKETCLPLEPLFRIIIEDGQGSYAPGDTISGKILLHSTQRPYVTKVTLELHGTTRTAKFVDCRSLRDRSPHCYTLATQTVFTTAALHSPEKLQRDRNTKIWAFELVVPSHVNPVYGENKEPKLTWTRSTAFTEPGAGFEVPPTMSHHFFPDTLSGSGISMRVDYQLEAEAIFLTSSASSLCRTETAKTVAIVSVAASKLMMATELPLEWRKNSLARYLRKLTGRYVRDARTDHPRIIFSCSSALEKGVCFISSAQKTKDSAVMMLKSAHIELTETIHTRTSHRQRGLVNLGEETHSTSQSTSISRSDLNINIPPGTTDTGLDLQKVMGTDLADVLAMFLPSASTVNLKISHRFRISITVEMDGQRHEARVEKSFKVPSRRTSKPLQEPGGPRAVIQHVRQDSAIDGLLCGDGLRCPIKAALVWPIDGTDSEGVYRKDWAVQCPAPIALN